MHRHNPQFIEEMKQKLLEEKDRLEKELGITGNDEGTYQFPEFGDKDDENAQEVSLFVSQLSVTETLKKELRDVNKALALIGEGKYGVCKYCNEIIDERRLRARPTSTSCVACKTRLKGVA